MLLSSTPSQSVVTIHAVFACRHHAMLVVGKASATIWPATHPASALCRRRPCFVALIGPSRQVRVGPNEAGLCVGRAGLCVGWERLIGVGGGGADTGPAQLTWLLNGARGPTVLCDPPCWPPTRPRPALPWMSLGVFQPVTGPLWAESSAEMRGLSASGQRGLETLQSKLQRKRAF